MCRGSDEDTTMRKTPVTVFLMLAVSGLLGGCGLRPRLGRMGEVIYGIELYRLADKTNMPPHTVRRLPNYEGGRSVPVHRSPLISSRSFVKGTVDPPVPGETERTLRIFLDTHGRYLWIQACREFPGAEVAVAIDGFFRFLFPLPARLPDSGVLLLRGPWRKQELEKTAIRVEKNYRILRFGIR